MSTALVRPDAARAAPPTARDTAVGTDVSATAESGLPRRPGVLRWGAGLVSAVGLLGLVVLAWFNQTWSDRALHDGLRDRAHEISAVWAANVDFRVRTLASYVESNAAKPSVVTLLQAGTARLPTLTAELDDLTAAYPTLVSANAVDRNGRIVASSAGSRLTGSDLGRRPEFRTAAVTGTTAASAVYASPLAGHPLVVNIITPVRLAGGSTVGYLMATPSLAKAQSLAMPLPDDSGLELTLVDQAGATILSSSGRTAGQVDPANSGWLPRALRGEAGTSTVRSGDHAAVVSFRPMPYGWSVAAALPTSTVGTSLDKLRNSTMALAAGLALALAVLGLLLHRAHRSRERVIARLDTTRGELADALARLRAEADEREYLAREVNDTIVQSLVAAEMSYDLGEDVHARDLLRTASHHARDWVGQQIIDEGGLQPGRARLRQHGAGAGPVVDEQP